MRPHRSVTLFLSERDGYDDGEPVVGDLHGSHEIRLAAGDLVLSCVQSGTGHMRYAGGVLFSGCGACYGMRRARHLISNDDPGLAERPGRTDPETVKLTGTCDNPTRYWAEV